MRPHFYSLCRQVFEAVNQCRTGAFPLEQLEICKSRMFPNEVYGYYQVCSQHRAEVSLMYYWSSTWRREISIQEYARRLTGYTGVIQGMIQEVPEKGTNLLERKLLADIHFLIPMYVRGEERRKQLIQATEDLATKFGISTVRREMDETGNESCVWPNEGTEHSYMDEGSVDDAAEHPPPMYREVMEESR